MKLKLKQIVLDDDFKNMLAIDKVTRIEVDKYSDLNMRLSQVMKLIEYL